MTKQLIRGASIAKAKWAHKPAMPLLQRLLSSLRRGACKPAPVVAKVPPERVNQRILLEPRICLSAIAATHNSGVLTLNLDDVHSETVVISRAWGHSMRWV